ISHPFHPFRTPSSSVIPPLSLHDALPILRRRERLFAADGPWRWLRTLPHYGEQAVHWVGWVVVGLAIVGAVLLAVRRWRILVGRSEEHTSELQSRVDLVCRLLLETKIEPR